MENIGMRLCIFAYVAVEVQRECGIYFFETKASDQMMICIHKLWNETAQTSISMVAVF